MNDRNGDVNRKRSEIHDEADPFGSEEKENLNFNEFPGGNLNSSYNEPVHCQYISNKGFARYGNALKHLLPFRRKTKNRNALKIDEAGFFSLITFSWMTKYIFKAYRKGLTLDDIPLCSPLDSCNLNAQRLESLWQRELLAKGPLEASFGNVVWRFVRTRVLISCLTFSISCVMGFLSPTIFMRKLLEYLEEPNGSLSTGIIWALALTSAEILRMMFFALYYSLSYRTALRLRSACLAMVYKKVLTLNSTRNTSTGEIINLYSFDGPRLYYMIVFGPMAIGGPVISICGFLYIYYILGLWALLGMLIFISYYPLQYLLSHLTGYYRQKAVKQSDKRIKLVTEILTSIKLIKMYAWENWISSQVLRVRKEELREIEKIAYCQSVGISLAPTIPVVSGIATFLIHVATGGNLTAAQVYTTMVILHTQLRTALVNMRYGSDTFIQGRIICGRFQDVLMLEEKVKNFGQADESFALSVKDGFFVWDEVAGEDSKKKKKKKRKKTRRKTKGGEETEDERIYPKEKISSKQVLHSINLSVPKGGLIGICGPVGAGKTSLLLACLGQLKSISGQISRTGTCAYVSQQSWLENVSLKENILFGKEFDPKKYATVLHACALNDDINFLPGGDETEVGERGVNLSGGQKQRIALARALYSDRDIYFLDDPLSAVDPSVSSQIFDRCILEALGEKTVVLVTGRIQFLKKCDEILVLKEGRIVERGAYEELANGKNEFGWLVESGSLVPPKRSVEEILESENPEGMKLSGKFRSNHLRPKNLGGKKLTEAEEQIRGTIKASAYQAYVKAAGGYSVCFFVVLVILLNVGSNVFSSWWLAVWIKEGSGNTTIFDPATNETVVSRNINDNPNLSFYMRVYASIIGLIGATCIVRGLAYTKVTIRASRVLHQTLFRKMLESPMNYFERTPIGHLQNLFSRDVDEIDSRLPESVETMLQNIWAVFFSFLSIILVFHWFVIPLVMLACLYYFVSKIFRVAIRDLKRMENLSRAPVFSSISATVQGLPVIHAFGKEVDYVNKFCKIFDENSTVFYLSSNAMRWMAVRLDFISVVISFITSFLVAILKGEVAPAYAGLALTYSAQICGVFQYTIRLLSENEARFISVERIQNNIEKLKPEGNSEAEVKISPDWPSTGRIDFDQVELSYGKDFPNVLNNISFSIRGGEKIGVVGRTGAGKSSLIAALFRLVELSSGKISIDGINIARVPLHELRSRLSVIPQDPTLFSETLRSNLDPFNEHEDDRLWEILRKTRLSDKVKTMPDHLSTVVGEGECFSVGEKQLVCLARTLLRGSKILVLDEATASIDSETETAVQGTIKVEFKDCTVITIAHRLSTVKTCDRILVVDQGKIVEFDDPKILMKNPDSPFAKMLAAASEVS